MSHGLANRSYVHLPVLVGEVTCFDLGTQFGGGDLPDRVPVGQTFELRHDDLHERTLVTAIGRPTNVVVTP